MLLCKYVGPDGIDILRNRRLLAQDPVDFNDPFEIYPAIEKASVREVKDLVRSKSFISEKAGMLVQRGRCSNRNQAKKVMRSGRKNIIKSLEENHVRALRDHFFQMRSDAKRFFRVICFCGADLIQPLEDILMWSHYSEGHKGLKIHFDSAFFPMAGVGVKAVTYAEKPVVFQGRSFMTRDCLDEVGPCLENSLSTKAKAWEYEHEVRAFVSPQRCDQARGSYYWKIPIESIRRIDCGVTGQQQIDEIKALISRHEMGHIELRISRLAQDKFAMEYDRVV